MKIIITGTQNFVGREIANCLDIPENEVYRTDNEHRIADHECLPCVDYIIHAHGALPIADYDERPGFMFIDTLAKLTESLEAARLHGTKIIYLSSCRAAPGEDGAFTSFGLTKIACEALINNYAALYGTKHVILQTDEIYTNNLDEVDNSTMINMIRQAYEGETIVVKGDGTQSFQYLNITDLVRAVLASMDRFEALTPGIFSLSAGNLLSVKDLLETIEAILDKQFKVVYTKRSRGQIDRVEWKGKNAHNSLAWDSFSTPWAPDSIVECTLDELHTRQSERVDDNLPVD